MEGKKKTKISLGRALIIGMLICVLIATILISAIIIINYRYYKNSNIKNDDFKKIESDEIENTTNIETEEILINPEAFRSAFVDATTEFNYYYFWNHSDEETIDKVTYERFVYDENENLIEATSESPFFIQSGEATFRKDKSSYQIPLYELQEGKNYVRYTEFYKDGSFKEKELVVKKEKSEYDKMYEIQEIEKTNELSLTTFQNELDIIIADYDDILLTGSFYSPNQIKSISYVRYNNMKEEPEDSADENTKKEYMESWKEVFGKDIYNPKKEAKIYGNYWAIDLDSIYKGNNRIDITITDTLGNTVTKTVYINDISKKYTREFIKKDDVAPDGTIKNEIIIYFNPDMKEHQREAFAKNIGGRLLSEERIKLTNKSFNSYEEAKNFCKEVMEKYPNEIFYITPNYYVVGIDVGF